MINCAAQTCKLRVAMFQYPAGVSIPRGQLVAFKRNATSLQILEVIQSQDWQQTYIWPM